MRTETREPAYGTHVAAIEPYSIEHIPRWERHGRTGHLFLLWFAANLTIADYALGFLPIAALGLPLGTTVVMLALGNLLGAALVGACAAMGIRAGYPQMFVGRRSFGRVGGYLPAALNWVSTVGWFTVNTILGAFALQIIWRSLPFAAAAGILVLAQTLIAVYGHNLIHVFEWSMAVVLGVLFAVATGVAASHWGTVTAYRPASHAVSSAAIVLAASFSYVMSWSPYASDYSRYLPERSSLSRAAVLTFLGSGIASFWLEVLGAVVAILALGKAEANSIAALDQVMGGFGAWAVVGVVLGACAANALNLYSNTMSARVLDLKARRWALAMAGGVVGFALAVLGHKDFLLRYQDFLLFLDYWITPWLAVVLVDFYVFRRQRPEGFSRAEGLNGRGLGSYLIGVGASVPFMYGHYFHGPIGVRLEGVDISYLVGFAVAAAAYLVAGRRAEARS